MRAFLAATRTPVMSSLFWKSCRFPLTIPWLFRHPLRYDSLAGIFANLEFSNFQFFPTPLIHTPHHAPYESTASHYSLPTSAANNEHKPQ